jgi:hypothetical protein
MEYRAVMIRRDDWNLKQRRAVTRFQLKECVSPALGNVGIGTGAPTEKLDVVGNVTISGSITKGSGSFRIDHPIKPNTHHLVHSFVEAPTADNIYRGTVTLIGGAATVNLDTAARLTSGTFEALNTNVDCWVSNKSGWTAVRGKC